MSFASKLKESRLAAGLEQRALATAVGTWQSQIAQLETEPEKGGRKIRPALLLKLARTLNIPVEELCLADDAETPGTEADVDDLD
jgi:transcriptional regulator with XRE-family HTH domain